MSMANAASGEKARSKQMAVTVGAEELDKKLGGGIPSGSLTLVEGQSDAGKSVLVQHFAFGSLLSGMNVAYYTTENTVKSLVAQMSSLGMNVLDYFLADRLRIYPLNFSSKLDEPAQVSSSLLGHVSSLPPQFPTVIVDAITNLVSHSDESRIIDLFSVSKLLCEQGRTLFLVVHSSAFSESMLIRVRSLCDAHFRLRMEEVGERLVKVIEVAKVRSAERSTGNVISFDVEPGLGIHIIPISKAKA